MASVLVQLGQLVVSTKTSRDFKTGIFTATFMQVTQYEQHASIPF